MQFISSALVEFEQPDITSVDIRKLTARQKQMEAFYYELYDSFLRGEKYIVRYMFYTLREMKRLTRAQLRKQFAAISHKAGSVLPEDMQALREEAGKREIVLYTDGSFPQEKALETLREAGLPQPGQLFTETESSSLSELKKAVFYAFRKDAFLLLAHTPGLVSRPLFYQIVEEYQIPLRSLTFPWMCRRNLKLMQAMTLYQLTMDNEKNHRPQAAKP